MKTFLVVFCSVRAGGVARCRRLSSLLGFYLEEFLQLNLLMCRKMVIVNSPTDNP